MKKRSATSLIIVFLFLLSYPIGPIVHCGASHSGLVCYCCSGMGSACVLRACSGCNHTAGADESAWSFETLLSIFDLVAFFQPLHPAAGINITYDTLDNNAPYKPPDMVDRTVDSALCS